MTVYWWHRYIGKAFTFGLLDIGNIVISIIAISNVILGILFYRGLLCRASAVYLNCINRGALELTKTIMCKPQVQNSDYDLPSTLTLDPYPWPLPLTLTLDPYPRPLPLTRDPCFSNADGGSQSQTNGTRHFGGTEPRGIGTFFFSSWFDLCMRKCFSGEELKWFYSTTGQFISKSSIYARPDE